VIRGAALLSDSRCGAQLPYGPGAVNGTSITLAVVAAVRLYREGLARILAGEDDVEIALSTSDWRLVASPASEHEPDVVLVDLPLAEARTALRGLAAALPSALVVALSVTEEESELISLAEAGVSGYVTRENSLADLVDVIRSVARGEMPCSPRASATFLRRIGVLAAERRVGRVLTSRELEIVRLIEHGLTNKQIGHRLCIEVATVKNHVHNILEKLDVHTRSDAATMVRTGLRPVHEELV
jgi:two-component system nitrate/nitrite response regulator NarL